MPTGYGQPLLAQVGVVLLVIVFAGLNRLVATGSIVDVALDKPRSCS